MSTPKNTRLVSSDDDGMRLDRWVKTYFPTMAFGQLQKLLRSGQIRVDGSRAKGNRRLKEGEELRLPPFMVEGKPLKPLKKPVVLSDEDVRLAKSLVFYEDEALLVFNKPSGLASQGGSKTFDHLDRLLEAFSHKGDKPRLVHRLDRDTSGLLVAAKSRRVAADMGQLFRTRSVRKIYWALLAGVPKPRQGEVSGFLSKERSPLGEKMVMVEHGTSGSVHSRSYYSVIESAGRKFAWVSLKPVTGRTHQLRVHMNALGTPIVGDPKYFDVDEFDPDEPLSEQLHLHARRLVIPRKGQPALDLSAPLPDHIVHSFHMLGFDPDRYDQALDDVDEQ